MKKLLYWSKTLKGEVITVALSLKDPRTPWYAKLLWAGIVAYALSPIDLIPDFIPVLGLLDDALLIPLGVKLMLRLIPAEVVEQSRKRAEAFQGARKSAAGAALVVIAWVVILAIAILIYRRRA